MSKVLETSYKNVGKDYIYNPKWSDTSPTLRKQEQRPPDWWIAPAALVLLFPHVGKYVHQTTCYARGAI
jgi:hypothetical protein